MRGGDEPNNRTAPSCFRADLTIIAATSAVRSVMGGVRNGREAWREEGKTEEKV